VIENYFSKNLSSFKLIKKTSLAKIFSYPLNFFILFFLLYYFDENSLATFILLETLLGLMFALFFASQNTIVIRELVESNNKDGMIFSIIILKSFLFILISTVSICLLFFFNDKLFVNYAFYEILYLLQTIIIFHSLSDLINFFSLSLLSLKKYFENFVLLLFLPISGIISLFITYLNSESIEFFLTLRWSIPFLILVLSLIFLALSNKLKISLVRGTINFSKNVKKIISLQIPIMPASFFGLTAVSLPILIFGFQQNSYNVILLGFLDRFFNPFRNALQTIISNLNPHFFGLLSKENSDGIPEFKSFVNIFLTISYFVCFGSIFFFLIFCSITTYQFSLGLFLIFLLKFITIIPFLTQILCNVSFFSQRDTVLISKITYFRTFINFLNIYFFTYGALWVIFIQFIASALPSIYSSRMVSKKYLLFNKLFLVNIFFISISILIMFYSQNF
tara:strand:- start:3701 stop:5050 length:1350 start_codon:yes stop_codon:yes gene_type:complete